MKLLEKPSRWRGAALIALVISAGGCDYLMFRVGRRNPSVLLMAMFAAWVAAPFAALVWCHRAAKQWSDTLQVVLHATSLLVAIASLFIYGYVAFGPARAQPAFFFLVVPFGSLVIIATVLASARTRQNA